MRTFATILAIAAKRKGGLSAIEAALSTSRASKRSVVAAIPDDRILAEMTRRVFNAGFSSKVVEAKWPAFEIAFEAFDPRACAFMSEERFDALVKNPGIVRNAAKIKSVQVNAALVVDLAAKHGSAARFFAEWPDGDYVNLLKVLKDRGSHLSGDAGQRFLREIGKPAFIMTKDVVAALTGAVTGGVTRLGAGYHLPFRKIAIERFQWLARGLESSVWALIKLHYTQS